MIAFRLDANEKVASGHLFRCLSIAKKVKMLGEECFFILSSNDMAELITAEGFNYYVLDLKWDDYLYNDDSVVGLVKKYNVGCIVVDSYHVENAFFEKLKGITNIFYLDDLCREAFNIDAVLHYSEWNNENTIKSLYIGKQTDVYSGMQYMPLRDGFDCKYNGDKKYDLLITTGGSDKYHISQKLIERIINDDYYSLLNICVVIGKLCDDDILIGNILKNNNKITVLKNINNINEIMQQSKTAVTAGGTTVYELMATGIPFVVFGFSDDQVLFGEKLNTHGNALYAGDARSNADSVVDNTLVFIRKLLALTEKDKNDLIENNRRLVDGNGAKRIAEIIVNLEKRG